MNEFLNRVKDKKEPQHQKKQPLSSLKKKGVVEEISAINFNEKFENNKNVFVFVYGDRQLCPHCQDDFIHYEKVAA